MISVLLDIESRFMVNRKRLREKAEKTLSLNGIKKAAEVNISVVGDRKMRDLNKKYRNLDRTTDVLSFSLLEEGQIKFVNIPDGMLRLGDVVISYPQAVIEAAEENKLVDDKLDDLLEHGLLHLLGIHHPE